MQQNPATGLGALSRTGRSAALSFGVTLPPGASESQRCRGDRSWLAVPLPQRQQQGHSWSHALLVRVFPMPHRKTGGDLGTPGGGCHFPTPGPGRTPSPCPSPCRLTDPGAADTGGLFTGICRLSEQEAVVFRARRRVQPTADLAGTDPPTARRDMKASPGITN